MSREPCEWVCSAWPSMDPSAGRGTVLWTNGCCPTLPRAPRRWRPKRRSTKSCGRRFSSPPSSRGICRVRGRGRVALTPGCQIGYIGPHTGCHQLNRVLTHNNNFDKSAHPSERLGDGGSKLLSKLRRDLLPTLYVNWSFWPMFHLLNFRYVPPSDRILYINAVQILFNVFLCWKAAARERGEEEEEGGAGVLDERK
jgi:hypothetical protein